MAAKTITGSCACGNITYTATEAPSHLDYCYCLTCQKNSGAPFMAWMGISKSALRWAIKNDKAVFKYRSTVGDTGVCVAERTCCGNDGCNIMLQYWLYPGKTHVAASTIAANDFDMPKVGQHIWTRHVPSWHTMPEDGAERYYEFDEGFQTQLDEYLNTAKNQEK